MDFLIPLIPSCIAVALLVHLGFCASIFLKRNDIADVLWGPGIALFVSVSFFTGYGLWPAFILILLVVIWAARLCIRIFKKNSGKNEDERYARWRRTWKWFYLRSYLQVYILQGILMCLVGFGTALFVHSAVTTTPWLYIGILIWMIGFWFETVGDAQLDRFISNPNNKGRLMTEGLWKYSRHPNYFGEITMWWGLWIASIGSSAMLFGLLSPITITTLICFVSGIPLLEESMKKYNGFAEYKKRTSVLIPLPPRTDVS